MGAALAVNVEAVEDRNMSNDCAHNRSQTRYFMGFFFLLRFTRFYLYTLAFVLLICLLVFFIVKFN